MLAFISPGDLMRKIKPEMLESDEVSFLIYDTNPFALSFTSNDVENFPTMTIQVQKVKRSELTEFFKNHVYCPNKTSEEKGLLCFVSRKDYID